MLLTIFCFFCLQVLPSLTILSCFWPFLSIFNHFVQCLTGFNNLFNRCLPYLDLFDQFWPYWPFFTVVYGFWPFWTVLDIFCFYFNFFFFTVLTAFHRCWLFLTDFVRVWPDWQFLAGINFLKSCFFDHFDCFFFYEFNPYRTIIVQIDSQAMVCPARG